MSLGTQPFRVSFRREILLLLPIALMLPLVLVAFTLISYRNAVGQWLTERQEEAIEGASRVAESLSTSGPPSTRQLRTMLPRAQWVAIVDSSGARISEIGGATLTETPLFDPGALDETTLLEPSRSAGLIIAAAPAVWGPRSYRVLVGLPGEPLTRQRDSLRVLTWVVLAVSAALALLLLFFLRHVIAPYDTLLARARQALPGEEEPEDEIGFLVASFERGLAALLEGPEPDDVGTVERMLGPSLESGVLLVGRAGEALALNQIGAGLLALDVPELPAPLSELLAPHPGLHRLIAAAVAESRPSQRQQIEIETDGGTRTLGLGFHPLRRDEGPARAFLVLFADLTESSLRAREENLATSLAHVGEMAAGVAHEMRNGLATIRGYLTLAERGADGESLTDYLEDLLRESDHLQRVLEDFLTFARPGSTRLERLDLAALAHHAAADPALSATTIRVTAKSGLGIIQGDRQLLERAVRNLLENAAQAQAEAGVEEPLAVELVQEGDDVKLLVNDRGTGIPEELLERLFQPFVTGRDDGVGLGLALAHRIVALHGGALRLENRAGGGARAVVSLPLDRRGQ